MTLTLEMPAGSVERAVIAADHGSCHWVPSEVRLISAWEGYLRRTRMQLDPIMSNALQQLLQDLSALPWFHEPTAAGVSEDGVVTLYWDQGPHHLEIELEPPGKAYSWFYFDRDAAGSRRLVEGIPIAEPNEDFASRLRNMAPANQQDLPMRVSITDGRPRPAHKSPRLVFER